MSFAPVKFLECFKGLLPSLAKWIPREAEGLKALNSLRG